MMPVSPTQSVLVRLLKKRENMDENPCPPLSSPADDLTVHIGNRKVTVSAAWLICQSPMVRQMLSVEMKEKQQRSLTLNKLGIDMEQFMDFLEAISSNALLFPILPNPKNVLPLLILADYFQVDWVKTRCANHMINCVEIPLIDRFFLAIRYQLDCFKGIGAPKKRADSPLEKAEQKDDETKMGKEDKKLVNNKKELLKKEIEKLQMQMDKQLKKILEEKIPAFVLEVNEIAQMIDNEQNPLESKFIQQLIDKTRPLYVDAGNDHLLLLSKVRILKLDKQIKDDVTLMEVLETIDNKVDANYDTIRNGKTELRTYHKDRTELERNLHRTQGDEALVEYDQRFIDILRTNLEIVRDFWLVLLKLTEEKMDILLTSSEKQKAKKNEHLSMYN
ncbi:hypothetical protein niasHT_009146 [Heterodera trifolii]|uniref:BTB domain-containing protein n=1 Tax=Heterodera trifolii TaxID=157864 RepID=A0ABD2M8R2_9BILA